MFLTVFHKNYRFKITIKKFYKKNQKKVLKSRQNLNMQYKNHSLRLFNQVKEEFLINFITFCLIRNTEDTILLLFSSNHGIK